MANKPASLSVIVCFCKAVSLLNENENKCGLVKLDEFGCGSMTVQAKMPGCIGVSDSHTFEMVFVHLAAETRPTEGVNPHPLDIYIYIYMHMYTDMYI